MGFVDNKKNIKYHQTDPLKWTILYCISLPEIYKMSNFKLLYKWLDKVTKLELKKIHSLS